ncbi:MAG: SPASM domain-containing protein [Pseudomonadota bacterium]
MTAPILPPLNADAAALDAKAAVLVEVEARLQALSDGLDHPDLWNWLAAMGASDTGAFVMDQLRSGWGAFGRADGRIRNLALCVLIAGSGNAALALEALRQLEAQSNVSTQIAGAQFFVSRLHDAHKSADLSTRFCEAPFTKFETLIDGTVAPCCSIWTDKRLGHLERQTADEIWNSADAQEMRASILDGSFRHCNKQRCTLIMEDTLPLRDEVEDPAMRAVIEEGKTQLDTAPSWLFLAHDITCNLACPSCRDGMIVSDEEQERRFEKIERQVFFPLLGSGDKITVSVSGQGDAWSSQHYRSILRYLADHDTNASLNIHTNALLMGPKRWAEYEGLAKYKPLVDVSIDACTPWVYEYVRRPGKWEKLTPNLEFLAQKRAKGTFSEFHLNATIQMDNFHEIPALIDYAEELGADSMRLYMMQNTGGHLSIDFPVKNIGDPAHPLHLAFLETLRDPRLERPITHMYDVANWHKTSHEAHLPSDDLPTDFTYDDLAEALVTLAGQDDPARIVALCAAGRIRFPGSIHLLRMEAMALRTLRYERAAGYRERMAEAVEAERVEMA